MTLNKRIHPDEKVPLKLTAAERKLLLENVLLDDEYSQTIRDTSAGKPVMMTLDDLEDFGGYVAAEANHCDDKKKERKLDAIFQKVQDLFNNYTDEEPPQIIKIEDAKKAKMISDQAVQLAEWAAQALVAAEQLRIKTKPVERFPLQESERTVLALLPTIPAKLKKRLVKKDVDFTVAEVASMTMAVAESLPEAEPRQQVALLMVAKGLMDCLQDRIVGSEKSAPTKSPNPATLLFQCKITLLDIEPPIWRRIQVKDCTLDKLHEHIQTAMGWTNSHLHQFKIDGVIYGDPELLSEGFEDGPDIMNSLETRLSTVVPEDGSRFRFEYEYDFGDGWEHDVLFEGCLRAAKGTRYPRCLEGERACPPEDVGGTYGYQEYLEAMADPKNERHEEFLEWSGPFDPEAFDAVKATKGMRRGLPNWREEE